MFDDTGGSMWHILVRWGLDHLLVDPGLDHSTADPCLESSWSNRSDSSEVFWALKATCKFILILEFQKNIAWTCVDQWNLFRTLWSQRPSPRAAVSAAKMDSKACVLRLAMCHTWKYRGNIMEISDVTFKSVMYPSYKSQYLQTLILAISLILASQS